MAAVVGTDSKILHLSTRPKYYVSGRRLETARAGSLAVSVTPRGASRAAFPCFSSEASVRLEVVPIKIPLPKCCKTCFSGQEMPAIRAWCHREHKGLQCVYLLLINCFSNTFEPYPPCLMASRPQQKAFCCVRTARLDQCV